MRAKACWPAMRATLEPDQRAYDERNSQADGDDEFIMGHVVVGS
jgi:hypothetical protein